MLSLVLGSSVTLILYIICLTITNFDKLHISKELEENFDQVKISISSFFDKMSSISIQRIINNLKRYFLIIAILLFVISFVFKQGILNVPLILFLWFFASLKSFGNNINELKGIVVESFNETKNLSSKLFLLAIGLFLILISNVTNIPYPNMPKIESIALIVALAIIISAVFFLLLVFLFHLSVGFTMALPAIFIFTILISMINISRFFNLLNYKKYYNFCIVFLVIMGSLFAYNQFLTHQ